MAVVALKSKVVPRPNPFPVPASVSLVRRNELSGSPLHQALVCETHIAALQTATVTSAINALRTPGRLTAPERISDFVPQDSQLLLAKRAWLPESRIPPDAIAAVDGLFGELARARAGLGQFMDDIGRVGVQRAEVLHRARMTAGWHSAAAAAIDAVKALDQALRPSLPERFNESVPILISLLNSVIEGLQPCVDASGHPFIPELPQRRLATRKSLLQHCTVQHGKMSYEALARDISSGGLGLEISRSASLSPFDIVVVNMDCGRRLVGTVMWAKAQLAGIKFSTPLPPNDHLLSG